ncbi:DUF4198 domain-containing protein [Sphingobacterium psychroaquaticum]|uniref:DUF4198 domain-containing protein n=1 Tax=Sphingobacterium psychroaquaticum TaxID=561061 RepID=UPI00106A458A|nr:DUF4198 domain-containing protein [Sphingobacterium psychroaquaticum]QBQ41017.1 DUF4198 domain-containing protein [Sphingobacterium psychroaquaticum]
MNFVKRILLLSLIVLGGNQVVNAHAVWLESNTTGIKNQSQSVRVYYGEYETGENEATKDWYSDLRELTVSIVHPDGSVSTLPLTDKGDFLEGTFVPTSDGHYAIFTSHATKDLGGDTRYEFVSQATVQVGNAVEAGKCPLVYQLQVAPKTYKQNDTVRIQLTEHGAPLSKKDVSVMSPSGWSKTYKSDAEGFISIPTLWSGRYVVEFGNMMQQEGDWHGKTYKKNWQGLTTSFIVQ